MWSDEELIDALRRAFESETRGLHPSPDLARRLERVPAYRRGSPRGEPRLAGLVAAVAVVVVALGVVAVALFAGHAGSTSRPMMPVSPFPSPRPLAVSCHNIIATRHSHPIPGGHVVLGTVVLPPRYRGTPVRVHDGRWHGWAKEPLAVRSGAGPVTITVPAAWRTRAAITWGNGLPRAASVRIARCQSPTGGWHVYVGGVFTRGGPLCLPLRIRDGDRARTARIAVGRRCR